MIVATPPRCLHCGASINEAPGQACLTCGSALRPAFVWSAKCNTCAARPTAPQWEHRNTVKTDVFQQARNHRDSEYHSTSRTFTWAATCYCGATYNGMQGEVLTSVRHHRHTGVDS